jgi:hypothetical protein
MIERTVKNLYEIDTDSYWPKGLIIGRMNKYQQILQVPTNNKLLYLIYNQ